MTANKLETFALPLTIAGTAIEISGMFRDGTGVPLVFLHGFGSTKEDFADVIQQSELADRPILAYDAPGCGATTCSDLDAISVPFLVSVALEVLRFKNIGRFHLVGHSMGGLTALLLADQDPVTGGQFHRHRGKRGPGGLLPQPADHQAPAREPGAVP